MEPKLMTENIWKGLAQKFKVKDNGLQKALAVYEKTDAAKHDERLKAVSAVTQLAGALKKAKDAAAVPTVVKYLTDMAREADSERVEIAKAKALAEKNAALAAKKAQEAGKAEEKEEAEEPEEGEYHVKLLGAFQKLKNAKGLAFEFIVCDAKPFCALMLAKKITPKHKDELTKVTGGGKRFLHPGTCQFVDGKFDFLMEQPVSGLAKKLQDSIKNFTGKKFPIKVGLESAGEDDGLAAPGASSAAAAKPPSPALAKAPELWHQTVQDVEAIIKQLKTAIQKEFAAEGPQIVSEVQQHVNKFDHVLNTLDRSLAEALGRARAAVNPVARQAELKAAKDIYEHCIKFVVSDPLVAHLDANPFGVKTDLKQRVGGALKQMAPVFV
jgi:hypothetical protein